MKKRILGLVTIFLFGSMAVSAKSMIKKSFLIILLGLIVFIACEKEEKFIESSIEGTYVGTLNFNNTLKSASSGDDEGTAVITRVGEGMIQVHCYGSDIDTTFMLNYYEHNDSILVCLNGEAFEEMYGHMLGQDHMMGGMMGDRNSNQSEWRHHLEDEHQSGEEHFGGFDMGNHSFNYAIKMENGYYHFNGQKQ